MSEQIAEAASGANAQSPASIEEPRPAARILVVDDEPQVVQIFPQIPAQRGYGATHRQWRAAILARDAICRACGQAPSTEADHITPLSQRGGWSLANGQGLCKPCHSRKTMTRDGGMGPRKISDRSYLAYRTAS